MSHSFYYNFDHVPDYLFWSIWSTVIIIAVAVGIVFYVFESLSLFTIAKRRGIPNYGLAWVPIGNMWIIGKLADQYDNYVKGRNMKLAGLLLGFGAGAAGLALIGGLAYIFILMPLAYLALIALIVFEFIALYKIYHAASPDSAVVLLVLSIFFSVIIPFVLFAFRKKDEGYERAAASRPPDNGNGPSGTKADELSFMDDAPADRLDVSSGSAEPSDPSRDHSEVNH